MPLIYTIPPPQCMPHNSSTYTHYKPNPLHNQTHFTTKPQTSPPTTTTKTRTTMGCTPSKPTRPLHPPPPPITRKQYRPPKPQPRSQPPRRKPARPPTAAYKYQSRPDLDPKHVSTYNKLTANSRHGNHAGQAASRLSRPFNQPYPGYGESWI